MNIESQPERTLVGIECRASNDAPESIGAAWQRFMAEQLADQIPHRADGNLIAVYCDYDGDQTQPYTFFLGCIVDLLAELPMGLTTRVIPAGRYIKRKAVGPMPAGLFKEWQNIWSSDLDRTYVADFEIHDPTQPDNVDVFVGVA